MGLHELELTQHALSLAQFSVEHALESIYWKTAEGRLVYGNQALCRSLGYTPDELTSLHGWDIAPTLRPEIWPARWREFKEARSKTIQAYHRSRSGEVFPVEVSTNYVALGSEEYLFSFARDIRELRRADHALSQLSGRLLQAQDEERRRIARELHDVTGQNLAALQIILSLVERSQESLGPHTRRALTEGIALVEACATEVRTLSYLLHPPLLDELGLLSALRNYVEGYAQRTGVRLDLNLPEKMDRLPRDVEIALFRIVQEGLTNIHRHSGSRTAVLRLKTKPGWVTLELIDHGRGMPPEVLREGELSPAPTGVGIAGMRERVRQLNGRLSIASGPKGTTLGVELPVPV
jgi:PAS domain S-box-containing protein